MTDLASEILPARLRHRPLLPPEPAFERATITKALFALRQVHAADEMTFRGAATEIFRMALAAGLARIRLQLESNGKGLACARAISKLEDDLIRAIHEYVRTWLLPQAGGERVTIVAVGGYGRGTLAPGSDIDLLFLLPAKPTPWCERVVEAVLHVLWDLRQKVGHATRSVDECLRRARDDMTIRTSVLEARLIEGDAALFGMLLERFDREIVATSARDFVAAKLAERDKRVAKAGSSRYLVEPNVKDGKGGLRDLNTLFWIAKYACRVRDAADLVGAGVFARREYQLFLRCEEFLWCLRCHLHFITGRAEDRLSFDQQRAIAGRLGYVAHGGLDVAERFMKHYFLIAKEVGDLTAIVCAALEERQAKPRAMLDRFMGRFRRRKPAQVKGQFVIDNDRISVARADAFEKDPVNMIRIFHLADETGLAIHPDATRLVTQSLKRFTAQVRGGPEANRLFVEILTSRNSPETVLRLMNEAGVLGRFIPDFGRVVAMMQFNMYHHYTVDEHLLRAVGILATIESGRLKEEHPLASEILPTLHHRRALYVALFLHDIAKGRETDHSMAGAEVARKLGPRFGLNEAESETVVWLVQNHLVMSNVAQGRDLSDWRTIDQFSSLVQTIERLKLLLILTVCDIRAVGPGVWNGWKGELLRTLYWETEVVLAGGHSAIDRKRRVGQKQDELRTALPHWSEQEFAAYAARHYPAYWLKVDLPRKIRHAQLLRLTEGEIRSLATETETDAFRGVTELTVVAPDHPRLLSIIAGACAASGANIVDAQIFTTNDGLALDTIFISRAFDRDEDELRRAGKVAQTIEKALRGEIRLGPLVAAKGGVPKGRDTTFALVPDVILDNNLSGRQTVIEVSGLDRPGLLFDLTNAISRLNLNIASSHIVTFGEKAVDSFYVTDLMGAKITSPARQSAIKRQLLEIFSA